MRQWSRTRLAPDSLAGQSVGHAGHGHAEHHEAAQHAEHNAGGEHAPARGSKQRLAELRHEGGVVWICSIGTTATNAKLTSR